MTWRLTGLAAVIALSTVTVAAQARTLHDTAQDQRENQITAQLNQQQIGYGASADAGYSSYGPGYSAMYPRGIQPQTAQMPEATCTPGMAGCAPVTDQWDRNGSTMGTMR